MTGLEIQSKKTTANDAEGVEREMIDLVEEYKLTKLDISKEDLDTWMSNHLSQVAETCLQQRIGAFKQGASELSKFVLTNFDKVTVYTGPSQNAEGSLAFAYDKDEATTGPVFLFFFDGMREGPHKHDQKALQGKLQDAQVSLADKYKLIQAHNGTITMLTAVCAHLESLAESDNNAKTWLETLSGIQKRYSDLPGFISTFFDK